MKAIKFLTTLVLAGALLFAPTQVTAHDTGCKPAPTRMAIPHWVQHDICYGGNVYATIVAGFDHQTERPIAIVSFYKTEKARDNQDLEEWIGSGVFEYSETTQRLGKLLIYGSASGRRFQRSAGIAI